MHEEGCTGRKPCDLRMCVLVYKMFKTGFCRCLPLLARSQKEEKKENEIMN